MERVEKLRALYESRSEEEAFCVEIRTPRKFLWMIPTTFYLRRTYLTVSEEPSCWFAMLTNGPDAHSRADGEHAYAADFCKDSGERYQRYDLPGVWKSAIGMLPVREEEERDQIFNYVARMIDLAHEQHIGS